MSQRPKILIVDDVPENVEILGEILADTHDILCAFSGEEALALAVEEPDLILLDVMMPGMDGYEVCARLKADAATATIPVIFVTAKTSPEDETAGFAAGAVDFVTKPVNRDTVQARIRTHLRLKHQSDRLRAQAMIDDLTGIPNRRYFETRLLDAWRHAQRHQAPLALLLWNSITSRPTRTSMAPRQALAACGGLPRPSRRACCALMTWRRARGARPSSVCCRSATWPGPPPRPRPCVPPWRIWPSRTGPRPLRPC